MICKLLLPALFPHLVQTQRHHFVFASVRFYRRTICIFHRFYCCDVVLFQAGADPHVDEPYGWALTSEQLVIRDTIAFVGLKELGIPVAWNLAGGYQVPIQKVLDIHTGTLKAYLKSIGK